MPVYDVWVQYTGGSSPATSLGGAAGADDTAQFSSQTITFKSGTQIGGVQLIASDHMALGDGTLDFDSGANTLTWTESGGTPVVENLGGDGYYRFDTPGQKLAFKLTTSSLPGANASGVYTIAKKDNNLFNNLTPADRTVTQTQYRCLFVKNNSGVDLTGAVVTAVGLEKGSLTFGSEYLGRGLAADSTLVEDRQIVHPDGTYHIMAHDVNVGVRPKMIMPGSIEIHWGAHPQVAGNFQDSDGQTTDLPYTIVDEDDSTQVLGGVQFKGSLNLPIIPAGQYVSFWVKRHIKGGTSGVDQVDEDPTLSVTFLRGV